MSFEDAVPVSRVSYSRDINFDLGSRGNWSRDKRTGSQSRKQKVNISDDTLLRTARNKLGKMVSVRTGYSQSGSLVSEPSVGSLLSTKA